VFINDLNDVVVNAFKDIDFRNKICEVYGKLNESENKYRLIFENSNVGIARIRYKDWFVSDCNKCFAIQMGYSSREQLVNNILMNESFTQNVASFFDSSYVIENNELKIDRVDNKPIYLLISAYAYWDEGYVDYMAVDITRQKEAEIEMEIAKDRAENADREKSEFITRINHQIRTPLSTVIGFSELLLNKISDEKHRKYLDSISNSGKQLLHIINDMLDFSKLEAGTMSLVIDKIDIKQLITSTIHQFEDDLYEKKIEILFDMKEDLPKYIYSDESRLKQIFFNILRNSVSFTEKGKIEIVAGVIEKDYKNSLATLLFEIKDTGIGIPKEEMESVFKPFVKKKGQDEIKYGGTGLGLSISRKIVSLMNGKIEMDSEVSVGSTFKLTLFDLKFEK
jgi:signal transduction histidine kinase